MVKSVLAVIAVFISLLIFVPASSGMGCHLGIDDNLDIDGPPSVCAPSSSAPTARHSSTTVSDDHGRIWRIEGTKVIVDGHAYSVPGTPTALVRGPEHDNIWATSQTASEGWVIRIATRSLSRKSPWPCYHQPIPACQHYLEPVIEGAHTLYDQAGPPTGLRLGTNGLIYYEVNGRTERILPFRGARACYEPVSRPHDFGCGHTVTRTAYVTHSGAAYVRTTCPRFNFRACHGTLTLVGIQRPVNFTLNQYDNPHIRVPIPSWIHLPRWVTVIYHSQEWTGITATTIGRIHLTRVH